MISNLMGTGYSIKAPNSFSFKFFFFLIVSLFIFPTLSMGQATRVGDQELRKFMELTPEQQQAIMQNLPTVQQGILNSEIQKSMGSTSSTQIQKRQEKEKGKSEISVEEISPETKGEEAEAPEYPVLIETKPKVKSLFERYKLPKKYQEISTDLKPFGYDFFQGLTIDTELLFPRTDKQVTPDYVIGPGDKLVVSLWGRIDTQYYLVVDRDGNLRIPSVGVIKVGGLRFDDVKKRISAELEKIYGVQANISMGGLKTIEVFVLGEVNKPGMYVLDSLSTILNAVYEAGGPNEIGSLRNIELKRNNKTEAVMDFYDFLINGDKSQDKVLLSGDVVFVPTVGPLVGIAGNVKRPAIYEMKDKFDLMNLFKMAGGIIPTAYTQQIQIERIKKGEKEIMIDINDKDLARSKDFKLHDGDLVKVFSIFDKIENIVTLSGNVKKPGIYEYKEGMRIRDIIKDKSELQKETYNEYAIIKRKLPPYFDVKIISFNLDHALMKNDIELKPMDEIHVFSKWSFEEKPYVTVEGEIRRLKANNELRRLIVRHRELKQKADTILAKGEDVPVELVEDIKQLEEELKNKFPYSTYILELKLQELEKNAKGMAKNNEEGLVDKLVEIEKLKEEIERVKLYTTLLATESTVKELISTQEGTEKDKQQLIALNNSIAKIQKEIEAKSESTVITQIKIQDLRSKIKSIEYNGGKTLFKMQPEVNKTDQTDLLEYIKVPIFENSRVRDAILATGGLTENAYLKRGEIIRQDDNGKDTRIFFNLQEAMEGDLNNNIQLNNRDRIVIHSKWEIQSKKTVSIRGEVANPGVYPYTKDMKVSDLIFTAGNLLDSAYMNEAELSYFIEGKENSTTDVIRNTINLKKALAGDPENNLALSPDNILFVKRAPEWGVRKYVTIEGQVRFQGKYNIKKGERLSSVLERAGGFTPEAYLKGAVFTREKVRKLQQENLNDMASRIERTLLEKSMVTTTSLLSDEKYTNVLPDISKQKEFVDRFRELKAKGRLSITLLPLNVLKGSPYDIELEAGDTLFVPTNPRSVQVVGSVFNQTSFLYDEKKDYQDYIDMAAGYTDMADQSRVYLLKADGTAMRIKKGFFSRISWNKKDDRWGWGSSRLALEPGDSIIVPTKLEKISWLKSIKDITSILYETAITVGVVDNLFNLF